MAGIRLWDKRLARRAGDKEHRTLFVLGSQYVLFVKEVLACFDPGWPVLNNEVAQFALAMFELVAIEDVQHAREGRMIGLDHISDCAGPIRKNRNNEAGILITRALLDLVAHLKRPFCHSYSLTAASVGGLFH
jgi:hypothetical protein